MPERKNILVCPLNWGLGHASRCIPVIKILNGSGYNVIIAAGGNALKLLMGVFPENQFVYFDDYKIKYSKGKNFTVTLIFQLPKISFKIMIEHSRLKNIIRQYNIDIVISDNRFGLWNRKVRSIYITHQVFIKSSFFNSVAERFLRKAHLFFMQKYDMCWVPDLPGDFKLSGDLSSKYTLPQNAKYIGILSDINPTDKPLAFEYDICAVLSGPEPQRTIFQNKLLEQFKNSDKKIVMILGKPSEINNNISDKHITAFSSLPPSEIQKYFQCSKYIIARSGYSTIMDLAATGKRAILIPTPGQPEQEYLAHYLSEKKIFFSMEQELFDLNEALINIGDYSGILLQKNQENLKETILNSI